MKSSPHKDYQIHHVGAVNSTMEIAHALCEQTSPLQKIAVIADSQLMGRGRWGKKWDSPPGNLYMSLVLPNPEYMQPIHLTFLLLLGLRDIVSPLLTKRHAITFKWPNDALLNDCKFAGTLVEYAQPLTTASRRVIIGIGINCQHSPRETSFPSISLKEADLTLSPYDLAKMLIEIFNKKVDQMTPTSLKTIISIWQKNAWKIQKEITILLPNQEKCTGVFQGIHQSGGLILRHKDGKCTLITAGDVGIAEEEVR
jgi:BirA family biotin operon repressor/biotin-[acetyl-CoA-carboxylase] ligase